MPLADAAAIHSYVAEQSINNPVLLSCTVALKDHLKEAGLDFFDMNPTAVVDDAFFASLDKRVSTAGLYPVIVATTSFGMRGFDYRSSKGITEIIAKSFDTARAAMQGLGRVGRFGDPCLRVLVKGVDLVDVDTQITYKSGLMNFAANHKKTVVKVGPLKKLIVESAPPKTTVVAPSSSKENVVPSSPLYFSMFPIVNNRSEATIIAKATGKSFYDDDDYHYTPCFSVEDNIRMKKIFMEEEREKARKKQRDG